MSDIVEQTIATFESIEDLSSLWKINDALIKKIRKAEKSIGTKKRKEKDPNAPKKEASPQLLEWNKQIHRIVDLSNGKIAYNDGRAIAKEFKEAGKMIVKKDETKLPTDKEIQEAIKKYVQANPDAGKTKAKAAPKKTKEKVEEEEKEEVEKYPFIIGGKSYNRADIEGKSYLWKEDGTYAGAFNEKTKKIDATVAEPQ
jgi:hypothetical protein